MVSPASRRNEAVLVALLALCFGALFTYPAWRRWSVLPLANDWDGHMLLWSAAADTVARFHQVPLWNPWACGGMPLLGEPESHVVTPFILLDAALGPVQGVKLEIALHLALMVAGGYVLGRAVGLSRLASLVPALVFAWSSAYPLHLGTGHTWALAYAYVPWVLALVYRAVERRRLLEAALAGGVLGLMADEGGTYPSSHTALLLVLLLGFVAVARRDAWPLAVLGATAAFALFVAAPHLFTTYELMKGHPRLTESTESTGWGVIGRALFGLNQDRGQEMPADRFYWGFHEYGAYLGPVAGVLALVGAFRAGSRAYPFSFATVVFLALALGGHRSPWGMLHGLPLFSSQRVPSRCLVMLGPLAGALGGLGLDWLVATYGSRARIAGLVALAIGAADAGLRGPPNFDVMYQVDEPTIPPSDQFRQFYYVAQLGSSVIARSNRGALNCLDALAPEVHAVGFNQPGYRGEEFLEGPGKASLLEWTPNALAFQVDTPEPTVLVVNQNYDSPWTITRGQGEVFSNRGLLGVRVPAGSERLELGYRSRPFEWGMVLLIAGAAVIAGLALRARREEA